jgi:hypothetical protein
VFFRLATGVVALLLVGAACAGDANLTDTGKGKPFVAAEFPATVEAGSTEQLKISVENPGPGDIRTIVVAFSLVGPLAGQSELPAPLIAIGVDGESPSVAGVEPLPAGISQDGVLYTFEGLDEGESGTFIFDVKVPEQPGTAANSVQVYDGQELERASGVRVETTVER